MRSIYGMPSDEMAGGAERRVPIPILEEEGKCEAFMECLPTKWQVAQSDACRYLF